MAFLIRMLENTKTLEHFLNSWITNVLGETLTWSKVEITWIIIIILLCVGKCSQSLGAFGPSTGGGGGRTDTQTEITFVKMCKIGLIWSLYKFQYLQYRNKCMGKYLLNEVTCVAHLSADIDLRMFKK